MKVSIIVINWNGERKLKEYLPKILKTSGVEEFIVTDDASTDNSVKLIKENFPKVKIVSRRKNEGFSSNVNIGVRQASGDLAFLLNPDAVPEIDCVSKALPYFKDPTVFSVGCNTGGNWSWAKWEKGFFWHYMAQGEPITHETMWARGGSGIFRKSIFDEMGGMDELFNPFYEEDVDLGYRAIKRGYKNFWVKECKVTLLEEKGVIEANVSRAKFFKISQRNQLVFIWKNITDIGWITQHIKTLVKTLLSYPKYWVVFLSAILKLPQIIKKRRWERKFAKLTDTEILGKFTQEPV